MRLRKLTSLALMAGLSLPLAFARDRDPDEPDNGGTDSKTTADSSTATATAASKSSSTHLAYTFLSGETDDRSVVSSDFGDSMYIIDTESAASNPEGYAIQWDINGVDGVTAVNITALRLWQLAVDDTSRGTTVDASAPPHLTTSYSTNNWLVTLTTPNNTASGTLSLSWGSKSFLTQLGDLYASVLYISADWISLTDTSRAGRTYTPLFALYGNSVSSSDAQERLISTSTNMAQSSFGEDSIDPSEATDPNSDSSGASSTNGSGSNGDDSDSSASNPVSSSNNRRSGLSTGAIIGIAVGCGAFAILLLGALVFFCIRRRRNRRNAAGTRSVKGEAVDHVHDGYESTPANPEFIAEKETHQRVAETPHSPYSDNVEGAVAGPSGDRSYTPYSDPPTPIVHPASPVRSTAASPPPTAPAAPGHDGGLQRAGSSTPHGLSRSVAALVEDGMTEDEIRRLEEEERALDAAIEHAERNR